MCIRDRIDSDSDEWQEAGTREWLASLYLDSHSEAGKIVFEYGQMDGTGADNSWGARDGIVGFSYGSDNVSTLTENNINILDETDTTYTFLTPVMHQFFNSTTSKTGTDLLTDRKVVFTPPL